MSKWPDPKDPSATFFSERAYKNYRSTDDDSHNSPARKNPEVPLFDAMLAYEKESEKTAEDERFDKMFKSI